MVHLIFEAINSYLSKKEKNEFFNTFNSAEYEDEIFSEEELKGIEEGRGDIEKGNYQDMDEVFKEIYEIENDRTA